MLSSKLFVLLLTLEILGVDAICMYLGDSLRCPLNFCSRVSDEFM